MYDRYSDEGPACHWYDRSEYSEVDVYEAILSNARKIDDAQRGREETFDRYLRLYSRKVANTYKGTKHVTDYDDDRVRWNVVKAVIESLVAMISTHRVRPYFMTFGGNYKMKRRAKNLNRFVHGHFTRNQVYKKMSLAFKHACIFGTGAIHVFETEDGDDGVDIGFEVVYPGELIVDDQESRDGEPRSMFRHRLVHRSELAAIISNWGVKDVDAAEAKQFRNFHDAPENAQGPVDESVSLVEAWHLPSGYGSKDGRHCIVCTEGTLLDEPWTDKSFPIKIFRYQEPPLGFWGVGVTEGLIGMQSEITYILQKIQKLMTLATTMWWVQKGSGVSGISNHDMAVREYSGRPPVQHTQPSVSAEYFSHLDRLWASAFEQEGISQLQATGVKPAGLNSGTAIRVHADQVSARFRHTQQSYEQFGLDIAEGALDVARHIAERGGGDIKVLCQGDKDCEEIAFKECNLDRSKYVLRVYPTGFLPEEPAGRISRLKDLMEVSPSMQRFATLAFSDIPDVESLVGPVNAPIEIVQKHIYKILDKSEVVVPLPNQDLELTVLMVNNAILDAENDGTPDDRLELLRQYLVKAEAMMRPPEPPPVPAAPAAAPAVEPMPAPGQPMLPPEGGIPVQ